MPNKVRNVEVEYVVSDDEEAGKKVEEAFNFLFEKIWDEWVERRDQLIDEVESVETSSKVIFSQRKLF